jgi:hypothetical protein
MAEQQMVEEKVETPQKPKWDCQFVTQPKEAAGYTVGEVFEISCEGEALTLKEPLKIQNSEKFQYSLVYLKTLNLTTNKIQFLATSYISAQYNFPFVHVVDSDGGGFISAKPVQWKVRSVIDPQKPPQNPFGPIQPMAMAWPYWIFFAALLVLAVFVGWGIVFFKRHVQKRNLEKNIRKFQSPMGSYHQFSKDMRVLKRGVVFSSHVAWTETQAQSYIAKLDEIFRLFVLREYIVPAQSWTIRQIARHVRKKNSAGYEQFKLSFWKAFSELERAQKSQLSAQDCEQLTTLCWQAVDSMWKNKKQGAA